LKNKCVREILIVKSSFSIIDQMFQLEMENAQKIKEKWYYEWIGLDPGSDLKNPLEMNDFIKQLIDPFSNVNERMDDAAFDIQVSEFLEV